MVGCWAFGCSNRSEHGLRFHTFPTCADRRKLWAQHVNRIESGSNPRSVKVLQPTKTAKLCEVRIYIYIYNNKY